jgi:hypothetical protein
MKTLKCLSKFEERESAMILYIINSENIYAVEIKDCEPGALRIYRVFIAYESCSFV